MLKLRGGLTRQGVELSSRSENSTSSEEDLSASSSVDDDITAQELEALWRNDSAVNSPSYGQAAVLSQLRLLRAHQLHRLLSQRGVTQPERSLTEGSVYSQDADSFQKRDRYITDSDAAVLLAFSNTNCFEALLIQLNEMRDKGDETTALECGLGAADALFFLNYTAPTPNSMPDALRPQEGAVALTHFQTEPSWNAAADGHLVATHCRKRHERPSHQQYHADSVKASRKQRKLADAERKLRTDSGGLVARSMQSWESHLAAELSVEGQTVEGYRTSKSKSSYLDKAQFQHDAQWNEFLRERKLEEELREMESKRAIRRGEKFP